MRKALPFVVLVMIAGCKGKLNEEKDVKLAPGGDMQSVEIDPISMSQTITVSAKGNETFNVFVFLKKDEVEAEKSINMGNPGALVLAHKMKSTEVELQATIPAKETAVVMLTSAAGKKAEVKLKITN